MRIWAKKGSKAKVTIEITHQDLKAKELKPIIEKIDKQDDKVVPQEIVLPKVPCYSPIDMF